MPGGIIGDLATYEEDDVLGILFNLTRLRGHNLAKGAHVSGMNNAASGTLLLASPVLWP